MRNFIGLFSIIIASFLIKSNELASLKKHSKNFVDKISQFNRNHRVVYTQPEQVHISYGAQPTQMIISWITQDFVNESFVEYGLHILDMMVEGEVKVFKDGGLERRKINTHRVLIENLIPGASYKYHVGSPNFGWSTVFSFTAMRADSQWSPRFAVFGDMGNANAQSLPRLQEETILDYYDAFLHVGDFAYDMHSDNARVGDEFMNQIQSIAAYVPYMTCVGNHEALYNFSNYVNRFNMPGSDGKSIGGDNNHFYSINIGPVHLIGFSTEFYYFLEFGFNQIRRQYEWLENDLRIANLPENRKLRPWIITMGHRPMYCSNSDNDDCTKFDDRVRKGLPFIDKFGLEELFFKNGVDVEFWAHEHSYERLWPIFDYKVMNGSYEEPYTNPGAPIHVVTGSAGCQEDHDQFGPLKDFTAFRASDYGYNRMQVFNSTHLYIEYVSDDLDGKIIDNFWIIKDNHESSVF